VHESNLEITCLALLMNALHGFGQEGVRYRTVQAGGVTLFYLEAGPIIAGRADVSPLRAIGEYPVRDSDRADRKGDNRNEALGMALWPCTQQQ